MSRRGFALLAVLWVLTALTALTGAGLFVARLGSDTTRNRVLLARAEWAREACGEILQARYVDTPSLRGTATIDLGRGTWCRAALDDPASRLNIEKADEAAVAGLFRALGFQPAVAESAIALRRRSPIYDLKQILGIDSAAATRLSRFLTTRGTGVVNVTAAPPEVLRLIPGMTDEAVRVLMARRSDHPFRSADELAGVLSRDSRERLLYNYAEFVRSAAFSPPQLIATLEGGIHGTPIISRAILTVVPVPGRLAVIRRETE